MNGEPVGNNLALMLFKNFKMSTVKFNQTYNPWNTDNFITLQYFFRSMS